MNCVNIIYENLRQLMRRALVGFHLRTPERFVMGEEWHEKNSQLFSLPSWRYLPMGRNPLDIDSLSYLVDPGFYPGAEAGTQAASTTPLQGGFAGLPVLSVPYVDGVRAPDGPLEYRHPLDVIQGAASWGWSMMVHRMDPYKGRYVAQSHGEGTVDIGGEHTTILFRGEVDAVSVFEPDNGIMTERVWTISMEQEASSLLADGAKGHPYWATGKLRMLGDHEGVELGESLIVEHRKPNRGQLLR